MTDLNPTEDQFIAGTHALTWYSIPNRYGRTKYTARRRWHKEGIPYLEISINDGDPFEATLMAEHEARTYYRTCLREDIP